MFWWEAYNAGHKVSSSALFQPLDELAESAFITVEALLAIMDTVSTISAITAVKNV